MGTRSHSEIAKKTGPLLLGRRNPFEIAKKAGPLPMVIRNPFKERAVAERMRAGEKAPGILLEAINRLSRSASTLTRVSLRRGNGHRSDLSIRPVLAGRKSRAHPIRSKPAVTRVISAGVINLRKKAEPGEKVEVPTKESPSRQDPTKDAVAMSDRSVKNGSPLSSHV